MHCSTALQKDNADCLLSVRCLCAAAGQKVEIRPGRRHMPCDRLGQLARHPSRLVIKFLKSQSLIDHWPWAVVSTSKLPLYSAYHTSASILDALPSWHTRTHQLTFTGTNVDFFIVSYRVDTFFGDITGVGRHSSVSAQARSLHFSTAGWVYGATSFVITKRCDHGCSFYLKHRATDLIHILTVAPLTFVLSAHLL